MTSRQRRFALFVLVNGTLVVASLYLFLPGKGNTWADLLPACLIAIGLVVLEFPLLLRARNWWLKALVFYVAMVLFFALFGLLAGWNLPVGSAPAGSWAARADAAARMIVFGHLLGGWLWPVVVGVNWLLRGWLFPDPAWRRRAAGARP